MKNIKPILTGVVAAAATLTAAGCDNFLEVRNPTVIEAAQVDPVLDAPTFSQSALNNLFTAFDNLIVYGAWFTGEAWVGDTFPTRNDIARRTLDFTNGTLNDEIYAPIALAISSGESAQEILAGVPDAARNINIARAAFTSAYGVLLEAEHFCQVVISSGLENLGKPLTPAQGYAEAVTRFQKVISVAGAAGGTQGDMLLNAARVGLARAYLNMGRYNDAVQAAAQVPAAFVFSAPRVDDPSNRNALGNTVYFFTLSRPSLVVPPYYRDLNDPRVTSTLGGSGFPSVTQGNDLQFHRQTKYASWNAPLRLASGLEARYIAAEAQLKLGNPAPATALIAERQATAAGAAEGNTYASGDPVLVELLDQKSRDFYLEGVHMSDWRRNPKETPYVLPAGAAYYVAGQTVGTQTCIMLPDDEVLNNPNFPRT